MEKISSKETLITNSQLENNYCHYYSNKTQNMNQQQQQQQQQQHSCTKSSEESIIIAGACRDSSSSTTVGNGTVEDGGARERLKRHRVEVAGRVWIPDMWGQENLLKDWIDCTAFDKALVNKSIMSARAALMEEAAGRRRTAAIIPLNSG